MIDYSKKTLVLLMICLAQAYSLDLSKENNDIKYYSTPGEEKLSHQIENTILESYLRSNFSSSGDSCSSHTNCTECYDASYTCHWCSFDSKCHAKGSIHGCSVGASCDEKNSTDDNSCHSHTNCTECYGSSYGCHWCAFDNQCHAKGSIHGCTVGASCENATDNSCASHLNCTDCSLSSFGCHWCEFDNKCHSKGSIYGCATGVDCFSNDRCERKMPQRKSTPLSISPFIDSVILILFLLSFSCFTFCFCGVRGMKESLDHFGNLNLQRLQASSQLTTPLLWRTKKKEIKKEENSVLFELSTIESSREQDPGQEDHGNTCIGKEERDRNVEDSYSQNENCDDDDIDDAAFENMDESDLFNNSLDSNQEQSLGEPLAPSNPSYNNSQRIPGQIPSSNILYKTCQLFYIFAVSVTVLSTFFITYFFPRIPVINVCSNEMEWKSIIDGLSSLKVEASFQILVSIYNANRIGVNLVSLSGTISHDGDYVGTYEIPDNTMVAAQSITDTLATINITPDKWEALELTSEYYKGTLAVLLDVHASAEVPFLEGYAYGYSSSGIRIHLNGAEGSREYCGCPNWDDIKPKPTELSFLNEWNEDEFTPTY